MSAFVVPSSASPANSLLRSSFVSVRSAVSRPNAPVHNRPARSNIRAAINADEEPSEMWKAAFESGAELRDRLKGLAEEREAQARRTEQRLNDMSERLANIVSKIREDAGMPPVAAPPTTSAKSQPVDKIRIPKIPIAADSEDSMSSDEPYMDPSNFGIDSAAGWQVLASENQLPQVDETGVKFRIECDENGCSIIEIQGDSPPGPGVRSQFLQSGPGYRIGYDPDGPKSFCATVGTDNWLLALSRDEIRHFKRLTLAIQNKMDRIARGLDVPPEKKAAVRRSGDGMFNERVGRTGSDCSVELESKLLWVQAVGKPDSGQYSIRAIFMEGGRQCEGSWAQQHVPGLMSAVSKLGIE